MIVRSLWLLCVGNREDWAIHNLWLLLSMRLEAWWSSHLGLPPDLEAQVGVGDKFRSGDLHNLSLRPFRGNGVQRKGLREGVPARAPLCVNKEPARKGARPGGS